MRFTAIAILLILSARVLLSQTPDWSGTVAALVYKNCSNCHHQGGIAPFALMSYDDAVAHGQSIRAQVLSRAMPPFHADPECSAELMHNIRLAQEEIDAIVAWVDGGMPAGNLATAPPPPIFTSGSELPVIDHVVQFPSFTVPVNQDYFRTFVVPSGFTSTKYLNQIEFQISNPSIVHHILLYFDPTDASYNLDMAEPGPGFVSNGTTSASPNAVLIAGWVPGMGPQKLPVNFGLEVPANAYFAMEIHYAPGSLGKKDSTKVNLKFCDVPKPRKVSFAPVLFHFWPSLVNGPLVIWPNTVQTFYERSVGVFSDFSLLSVLPHAHLICKSFEVYMFKPGSPDTVRLVCIPNWDFKWQRSYYFKNLIRFNANQGYVLGAKATYDNTANNPNNPNNPPQLVTVGEKTTDEMMVVFFAYLDYQPGDELLDLEVADQHPSLPPTSSIDIYPNPVLDRLHLNAWLEQGAVTVQIWNAAGLPVLRKDFGPQPTGAFVAQLPVHALPAGLYFLEVNNQGRAYVRKFIKE